MQIAQVLAGYTLGGADMLRRAMGKKKPEEMAKQRVLFTEGAVARGVEEKSATYIFDLMEKFAGYGFNKSHSAAYALVSYQTAWLKAHYPAPFMAAVLSADMDNTDKVVILVEECRNMELEVIPPDINRCQAKFTAADERTVLYGLGAIKGVGVSAMEGVIAEREAHAVFVDIFDFCHRVDLRKVNRRLLEAMIRAGAFDQVGPNRATTMHALGRAVQMAEQHHKNQTAGFGDLFGFDAPAPQEGGSQESNHYEQQPEWQDEERLAGEKETLGLYLTGHPIERYETELANFVSTRLSALKPDRDQVVVVAGLVVAIRTMNTKRGDRIAFVTLDDRTGRLELAVFSENYQRYRELLVKDSLLVVEGTVTIDDFSGSFKMSSDAIYDIEQARERFAHRLEINLDNRQAANGFIDSLTQTLKPYSEGLCPVWLAYQSDAASAKIALGPKWRVKPSDELLHRLEMLAGESQVRMVYR